MGGYKKRISRIVMVALLFVFLVGNSNMVHAMGATQVGYASKYITVKGNNMHLALYGKLDASGEKFADEGKTTLVMMPALGVPSPHIYFKPLAQSLGESFNIVIVEPFGYGLSDVAATDRTVDNINSELNAALDTMGIKQCVLLVHSISGVYGLNFVQNYPEKVKGFIAVDNTVYDEELAEAMEMEKKYMMQGIDEFQKIKNSFSSLEEFQMALKTDPEKYGAALPQVSGYTYTESDREEYIQAYSLSSNDTIRTLFYDTETGRYDIRFDLESFYGGLHCGECFDVKVKDIWIPVRIEMGDDWYLVGLNVSRLDGLRVRM